MKYDQNNYERTPHHHDLDVLYAKHHQEQYILLTSNLNKILFSK